MAFEPIQVKLYGTETVPGEKIVHVADTSTSIVVDWTDAPMPGLADFVPDKDADIPYKETVLTDSARAGDPLTLYMDVYYDAKADQPRPGVLLIPGGGYMTCRRTLYQNTIRCLVKNGFVAAVAEYHVVGQGFVTDAVADVNDALRYLRANAKKWNLDPKHLSLLGGSAGGHLVALTAATLGKPAFDGYANIEYSARVDAVVDLYGISDMTRISEDYGEDMMLRHHSPNSSESQYVNGVLSHKSIMENPEGARAADPVTHIDGKEPPYLLMHGNADLLVSPSQTLRVHEALRAKGGESTRYVLKGAPHGGPIFEGEQCLKVILEFLQKHSREL